jgi:F-type H+-transporting ATPase subunit epsilon
MISLKIVTPLGEYFNQPVKSINVRTVEGQIGLLPNHMPLVAALVPCKLAIVNEAGEKREYAISGGFLHFDDNKALLLTDAAEGHDEIDLERAKAAYERARKRIDKKDSTTNMKRAELALQRAMNRINVAND